MISQYGTRLGLFFRKTLIYLTVFSACFNPAISNAYEIVQNRGVDQRVDYKKLANIGAWDDRNYSLTLEDVRLLSENEPVSPLPAFYRVKLKREAGLRADMPVEYNRSQLNHFLQEYGGFEVNGKIYR